MFTRDILLLLWLITAAFLYCGSSLAFSVLQFDASAFRNVSEFNSTVSSWRSIQGGVSLSPCHTISNGWSMPFYDKGAICFIANSGVVSPLAFSLTETSLVSRVFIVAKSNEPSFCSTLIDAPCPIRLFQDNMGVFYHFSTSSVLSKLKLSIDFASSLIFSQGRHIYEIAFDKPYALNELYIGGNPSSPAWKRNWKGSIFEIILASPLISEIELSVIRAYLSKKWRLGNYRSDCDNELKVLKSLGIKTSGIYGSILIMR